MRSLTTPAVALFFLMMFSSGPYSAMSIVSEIKSPNKSSEFYVGALVLTLLVITIIVLALIVRYIDKIQKGRFK